MITTHVLDTSRGGPAKGVMVILEMRQASDWSPVGRGETDEDGRLVALAAGTALVPGTYRLTFDTGDYQREHGQNAPFFPEVTITFSVRDAGAHYHVPLLLSPYGYSTYRGT
jgi:5-hydroxyisourate hydrolase